MSNFYKNLWGAGQSKKRRRAEYEQVTARGGRRLRQNRPAGRLCTGGSQSLRQGERSSPMEPPNLPVVQNFPRQIRSPGNMVYSVVVSLVVPTATFSFSLSANPVPHHQVVEVESSVFVSSGTVVTSAAADG